MTAESGPRRGPRHAAESGPRRGPRHAAKAAVFGLFVIAAAARAQPVFYEEDGVVVAEVESAEAKGWRESTQLDGYTGRCYYVDTGGGKLVYRIVITSGGRYSLRIRNRHDHPESDKQNDCWTSMDGGRRIKTYSSVRGEWTWATRHEDGREHRDPSYDLEPGVHTFEMSSRSKGFMIDRFVLYKNDARNPTDTGLPETGGGPPMPELNELKRLERYWRRGMLGSTLAYARKRTGSGNSAEADEARKIVETLTAYARERRARIERMKPTAPAAAVDLLADLAKRFMPSKLGKDLRDEAMRWNKEPATVEARRAALIYEAVRKAAEKLEGKGTAADPKFAQRFAREIQTIRMGVKALQARYAQTAVSAKATSIAHKFGVKLE